MRTTRVYLAGPMTGYPDFNYPAFDDAAANLRALGYEVVNPAENHDRRTDLEIEEYFATDLPQVCRADAVAVLPGWKDSGGASLEVALARHLGHPVIDAWTQDPVPSFWEAEREDVLSRFAAELAKATGDGSRKRQSGDKPPWYRDPSHEGAIFSHLTKWKRGEKADPDSGAHPLVHGAWRMLAIACSETGNVPEEAE